VRRSLEDPQILFAALSYGKYPCLCTEDIGLADILNRLGKEQEADAFIDSLHDLAKARGLVPFKGELVAIPGPAAHPDRLRGPEVG
jgi:hypothetical protein